MLNFHYFNKLLSVMFISCS